MAELKDSGERREFETGAVRDIQEGKGRCDLLPLDVVARVIDPLTGRQYLTLFNISKYVRTGDVEFLYLALKFFMQFNDWDSHTAILEVAKHYEDGARKYSARNWEKGIPIHCFIDSGVRHFIKHCRGDLDEPHDRAFVWNMFGAIWTHNNKPELIDLPIEEENKDENN